ncbi:glycosyltransferase [Pasteuria penetrans]|uniref:glycosyltransferase n=1 Tax=Pasteuria penetrans TaxID=86005 RepID=UPI000FB9863F|nr:glycosyltransferase [Pasteuria penetrans]
MRENREVGENGSCPKLVLSMIVHNEADRYLRKVLMAHREWVDAAVIIDDGSTDHTVAVCEELLSGIPLYIHSNPIPKFGNEVTLREQQWEATIALQPEWILNLDADEVLDPSFFDNKHKWLNQNDFHVIYFRLYDMWDEKHYRDDPLWCAHRFPRPYLIRYLPNFTYIWRNTPQHCGRFPFNVLLLPYRFHSARIRHYGWARSEDRREKYERYRRLDPDAQYGIKEQYDSILDENPNLIPWEEDT